MLEEFSGATKESDPVTGVWLGLRDGFLEEVSPKWGAGGIHLVGCGKSRHHSPGEGGGMGAEL